MFDRLQFLCAEAFTALKRNLLMTFAAITTVAVSLFLLGGFGYMYFRIRESADTIPNKFDIRVFLKDDATKQDVSTTAQAIRGMPGVKTVAWLPKDKMWDRTIQQIPEYADLPNQYPEALKVTVSDLKSAPAIVDQIRQLPSVSAESNGVVYRSDEQRFVEQVLSIVRWVGATAGGLLFLTAGLLIYNAIRLTILSRRLEIRIMRLVGASSSTVYVPFLVEGFVQGVLGGALAVLLLWGASNLITGFVASHSALGHPPTFPLLEMAGLLCGAGALYGLLCSSVAMRTPLRFR